MLKDKRKYILLLLKTDEYSTKQKYWDPTPDRCRMIYRFYIKCSGHRIEFSLSQSWEAKEATCV